MMGAFQQLKCNLPESRLWQFRLVGAGAAAMTISQPTTTPGVTMTQVGTGDHKMTFKENPGVYCGADAAFQSATMTDLKQFTIVFKDYDAVNFAIEFTIFNGSGTAVDLSTAQSLNFQVVFKYSNL